MKTLITLSIIICTSLAGLNAQSVKLQSHMTQTDWVDQVLLNGNPLSESALNNFPIPTNDVLSGTNTIEFVSLPSFLNGVSSLDIVFVRRHLSDIQLLEVDAIIPADIDKSGYIGVNDIAIMQELILGIALDNEFAFVNSGLDLNSLDPLDFGTEVYSFQFEGADFATTNFVFDVYVHGDINKSSGFAPQNEEIEVRESNTEVTLEDIDLISGLSYQIPFTVQSDKKIEAFQMGMSIEGLVLDDVTFESNDVQFRSNITDEFARLSVMSDNTVHQIKGVFTITATRDGKLSELISQESDFFDEIVFDDLSTGGLKLEFRTASSIGDLSTEDIKLSPSPAVEEITVSFPKSAGSTNLYIHNAQGQLISTKTVSASSATIQREDVKASGVYIVTIEQEGQTVQKKFVML